MLSTCWECRSRAPQLLPQELSNLAWSSGKLFAQDQLLSQTASEACLQNAGQFGPQNLSNAAWRFATSAVLDRPLMQMTSDQGINISGQLDAQDVSNLGRASSTLDSSEAALVIYLPEACSWEVFQQMFPNPIYRRLTLHTVSAMCADAPRRAVQVHECCQSSTRRSFAHQILQLLWGSGQWVFRVQCFWSAGFQSRCDHVDLAVSAFPILHLRNLRERLSLFVLRMGLGLAEAASCRDRMQPGTPCHVFVLG